MKKSLWMLGMAVVALTSCTQSEVLDIPERKVIEFDTHVNNLSRFIEKDVNVGSIEEFHVFGYLKNKETNNNYDLFFNNVKVVKDNDGSWKYVTDTEPVRYWDKFSEYHFAAYSNGLEKNHLNDNSNQNGAVEFNVTGEKDKLVFEDYKAGINDLVASIIDTIKTEESIDIMDVHFNFYHMLSKVRFAFYANTSTELQISDVTVHNAINVADGEFVFQTDTAVWKTDTAERVDNAYISTTNRTTLSSTASYFCFYIIPQSNKDVTVSFNLHSKESENNYRTETYTANLETKVTNHMGVWKSGCSYLYNLHFSAEDFNLIPIDFAVEAVDGWDPATSQGSSITPELKTN